MSDEGLLKYRYLIKNGIHFLIFKIVLDISNQKLDYKSIDQKVYALKTISSSKSAKLLSYWLMGILLFLFLCLFLPWQQNIEGSGQVTAFTPQDRPQEVNAVIAGRIKEWRIIEGQYVTKGDTLAVLDEIKSEYFDPELLTRLKEQLTAKTQGITANQNKIQALDSQISALQIGLQLSLEKARNKLQQAQLKVNTDSAELEQARVAVKIAERQMASYNDLFKPENENEISVISRTQWEQRQNKLQEEQAKLVTKENKLLVSKNELINAKIELSSLEAEYNDKIAKARSDQSSSFATLAEKEGDLSKLRNYYANMNIRNNQYYILAPQDGYIVKTLKSGLNETLKEMTAICTIQPDKPRVAVELYVNAMDVPLITKGRQVRLEFDGWPALQVTGWPSVAVGTFGGIVKVIDFVDSKEGKYRLLIEPDPTEPWPEQLRVGSGVYGWIMLDDVSVWYEIWRQLNGFPPSLYEEPEEDSDKAKKSDKKIKLKVKG